MRLTWKKEVCKSTLSQLNLRDHPKRQSYGDILGHYGGLSGVTVL